LLLFSSHNTALANCGFLSFGTPVIESSGKVRVDVNYLNLGVTFQDFDVHVSFSSTQTSIDFTLTNASTGSGYSATQFGSNSRVVQITGQNFSFGSTITICKIYFELPAGTCTDIDFTRIANIIAPSQGCSMSNTSYSNVNNWCKPSYSINGKVENLPYGVDLRDVKLTAEDISPIGYPTEIDISNSSGDYDLDNLEQGGDYRVSCEKLNNIATCGIANTDITAIQQHIAGSVPFSFPWQYIAADVSGNRYVTTQDILFIQDLLLNGNSLPKEWTFVSSSTYGGFGLPPSSFKEYIQFNNLSQNQNNKVFYGIKGGDVDGGGCATPGLLQEPGNSQEDVTIKSYRTFRLGNVQAALGEEVLIPIYALRFKRQSLFSLSLAFDTEYLELLEVVNSNLPEFTEEDYVINFDQEGTLDVLWFSMERAGISLRPNEPLFYIKARAKQSLPNLHNIVRLRLGRMENKIFNVNSRAGESIQIVVEAGSSNSRIEGLNYYESSVEKIINLVPNPFTDILQIQFHQPSAGNVIVRILDPAGKVVLEEQAFFEEGKASFELDKLAQLPDGAFFYQLIQGDQIHSGKLLKLE